MKIIMGQEDPSSFTEIIQSDGRQRRVEERENLKRKVKDQGPRFFHCLKGLAREIGDVVKIL